MCSLVHQSARGTKGDAPNAPDPGQSKPVARHRSAVRDARCCSVQENAAPRPAFRRLPRAAVGLRAPASIGGSQGRVRSAFRHPGRRSASQPLRVEDRLDRGRDLAFAPEVRDPRVRAAVGASGAAASARDWHRDRSSTETGCGERAIERCGLPGEQACAYDTEPDR
jgi:hypothetical protein